MTITNLEEKQNRKLWVPIREGNRGGWSLFNWQDVREMPYKDRQMYLGNSVTIGVLDKGGKWRKRDWYMKTDKKYQSDQLTSQQEEAIRKDNERMNAALGITERDDEEKLTEYEMRQLMKKIKMKKQGYEEPTLPDAIGLGFDKTKVEIRSKPSTTVYNPHRLEAVDQISAEEKPQKNQRPQKKEKKEEKEKKEKKIKKEKKQKKKKDKQHKHRSRDDSAQKESKKKKKEKHKKRSREQKEEKRKDRSRSQEKRRKRRHPSSSSSSDSD